VFDMKSIAFPAAAAALFLAIPAAAQSPAPALGAALCRLGYSPVPLRVLASGHQLVSATINGNPGTFIVDTGAGASVVHQPALARFGLLAPEGGRTGVAIGAAGRTGVAQLAPAPVVLGGMAIGPVTLFGADIGAVVNTIRQVLRTEVHGVIGQDLLRANGAVVDVANARLFLRRPGSKNPRC
jgi:predicted aspartyl protease